MNNVVLKGRLTKDVEVRYTQSADPKAFATFSIAVNRIKQGECDFINCKAWGKTAEFLGNYFKKGQEICLVGRIEVSTQETNGERKTFTNVVAENVEFCGSKKENDDATSQPANTSKPKQVAPMQYEEDDDLPF